MVKCLTLLFFSLASWLLEIEKIRKPFPLPLYHNSNYLMVLLFHKMLWYPLNSFENVNFLVNIYNILLSFSRYIMYFAIYHYYLHLYLGILQFLAFPNALLIIFIYIMIYFWFLLSFYFRTLLYFIFLKIRIIRNIVKSFNIFI